MHIANTSKTKKMHIANIRKTNKMHIANIRKTQKMHIANKPFLLNLYHEYLKMEGCKGIIDGNWIRFKNIKICYV